MKFVKTAVAVAIAGIAAAPMIASADTTLSGVVQVKVAGSDAEVANVEPVAAVADDPATPDVDESAAAVAGVDNSKANDPSIQAGDVRIGVVSEHELNSGLTGYGSIKLTVDDLLGEIAGEKGVTVPGGPTATGSDSDQALDGSVKADDIYVGIKGGFGDFRVGEIPLAIEYGQLANDIHDVSDDVGDGMSYTGTFGPASIVLNYSPAAANDSDLIGAGAKFNFAGATIGLGFEDKDDGANASVGVSYAIAGFSIAAQYWAQEGDFSPNVDIDTNADDEVQTSGFDLDDTTSIAIKVGYTIAGVNAAVTYSILESQSADGTQDTATGVFGTDDAEETVIRLDLGYDLGGGMDISTRIDNTSDDDDASDDVVNYRLMLTKAF